MTFSLNISNSIVRAGSADITNAARKFGSDDYEIEIKEELGTKIFVEICVDFTSTRAWWTIPYLVLYYCGAKSIQRKSFYTVYTIHILKKSPTKFVQIVDRTSC